MKTLIIVDDSKTFQKILERALTPYFKVLAKGSDGLEAIKLYKEHQPDIILLDITMPNCDGTEALKKIIEFNSNANVVMVSGIGDEETISECLKLGARSFVSKTGVSSDLNEASPLISTLLKFTEDQQLSKVA